MNSNLKKTSYFSSNAHKLIKNIIQSHNYTIINILRSIFYFGQKKIRSIFYLLLNLVQKFYGVTLSHFCLSCPECHLIQRSCSWSLHHNVKNIISIPVSITDTMALSNPVYINQIILSWLSNLRPLIGIIQRAKDPIKLQFLVIFWLEDLMCFPHDLFLQIMCLCRCLKNNFVYAHA